MGKGCTRKNAMKESKIVQTYATINLDAQVLSTTMKVLPMATLVKHILEASVMSKAMQIRQTGRHV